MGTRKIQLRSLLTMCILAMLVAVLAHTTWSQEITAAITGKVTDPSGAAIAGAQITATDVDRGTVWKTDTNMEGFYNLPRLPVGNYEMRVEATGFQTAVRPRFNRV